jgi:hypothetical protein
MRRPIALFIRLALAYEFPRFCAAKVPLTLEVIDVGPRVHPDQLVTGACHTDGRGMVRGLRDGERR